MNPARKAANWEAVCAGRDLLEEIEQLKANARKVVEAELREKIASQVNCVILKPQDHYTTPTGDH